MKYMKNIDLLIFYNKNHFFDYIYIYIYSFQAKSAKIDVFQI